jgi:HEAT repeat protein
VFRLIGCILFVLAAGPAKLSVRSQPPREPTDTAPSEHSEQLKNIRDGLLDPEVRPENRRRFADLLLSYNSPQARALTVELLGLAQSPDVQRALCTVIADRARRTPERLDESYVQPLLNMLDASAEDLRLLASRALADFPGAEAPRRLGQLAVQDDAPLARRLAAIDALASRTHRREVVGQLINLLDAGVPEVTERVLAALEPATRRTFGSDLDGWRRWWQEKSRLSDEAWSAEQLQIYRERYRQTADELRTYREETRREHDALIARMRGFQRDLFRVLNVEQREAKLLEWLDDPLPVVKLAALTIIKARIADEGKRPEGKTRDALIGLLKQGSPEMRREVLGIVQNLNNPVVVEAVLAQLEQEVDPPTRQAMFKAIGKLASPATIPALIREITGAASTPECVREAAIALGRVAAAATPGADLRDAAAALKGRYNSIAPEDVSTRAALLTAMAGTADSAFTPEFLEAIEQDNATLLSPAISGLLAVRDTSKLPRLRTLMAHPDPLVRVAAIEAVGQLGREDGDLESLLTRLNRAVETNEHARDAAWRGLQQLLSNRPTQERIKAAERLRDYPDLEVKYLAELADALSKVNGGGDLETVLDRLATALVTQGRHGEAVEPLQRIYGMHTTRPDARTEEYGRRLLEAALRSPANTDVAELIAQLAVGAQSDSAKTQIVDTVAQYLESPEAASDAERARKLLSALRSVPPQTFDDAWTRMLERASARLQPANGSPAPSPPTTD